MAPPWPDTTGAVDFGHHARGPFRMAQNPPDSDENAPDA